MKDTWLNHNTDKILLFLLALLIGSLIIHILHHGPADTTLLQWAENSFDTVLGALIMVLTGRINRADGQTANGTPAAPPPAEPAQPAAAGLKPIFARGK